MPAPHVVAVRDGPADDDLERLLPAAVLGEELGKPANRLAYGFHCVVETEPAVAVLGGPAQRCFGLPSRMDRRVWALDRLRLEHHRLERVEVPVVGDHLFAPQALADSEGLVEPPAPGARVEPGRDPLLA